MVETATIIGLISSFVTFEECLWAKLPLIGRFCKKKKVLSKNWKSDNIVVQACVERFKDDSWSEYREHIFNEDEKQKIVRGYFEHNPDLKLNAMDRKSVELFIVRILDGFNEYNRSVMTPGERILQDSVSKGNEKILSSLEELKNQGKEDNKRKFIRAVNHYKNDDAPNIDCKINGFYEIDRSTTINQIKKDVCRLISIIGAPGSGKTVLCKKLLESEENVLYARAERVATCNNISEIWNCDLESLLENGFQEKLYIFIDALEFIADNSETVKNKLQEIFSLSRDYQNVCVVTSCRTSDKNSFAKLWSNYNVKDYEISELNDGEIESIIQAFPCLKKLKGQKGYSDLLKSPFYVNLIVSKIGDDFEIKDENELRTFIWENVVCLRSKASEYGVVSSEIKNSVERIVFERARKFTPGVNKEDLNSKILNILLSEKIVVQNGDLIRLSYDIFEDICFEQTFNRLFVDCKGDYSRFFNDIESYGRCAYRRYQIWISNKILASDSREKFLHELIFSNYENDGWKQQTQIGIVKSKYSNLFFEQYSQKLVDENLLIDFLKIVNLYGFEGTVAKNSFDYAQISLKPVGNSRECLIKIIESNNLYQDSLNEADVLKLCADYSKVEHRNTETSNAVCKIVEYYYDLKKSEKEQYWYCKSDKDLTPYLNILYQLSDSAKEWLKLYLQELKEGYASQNREIQLWSEKLIEWTLVKNVNPNLVKEFPNELCELADAFWLQLDGINKREHFGGIDKCDIFGLSENASDHHFTFVRRHGNPFFVSLLNCHFWIAFEWAINFVNHCVEAYSRNRPDNIDSVRMYFTEGNRVQEYLGNGYLYLSSYVEYQLPLIISDVVYNLKITIINLINGLSVNANLARKFAYDIRKAIFEKTNNVAFLSIIEDVGLHFRNELPGYTLDLASNTKILFWDIQRYCLYHKDQTTLIAENQMKRILGVFAFNQQYILNPKCDLLLRDYVVNLQINGSDELKQKCYSILDYLYSINENNEENAERYLQIQMMDVRIANVKQVSSGTCAIIPSATGAAKNLVEKRNERVDCDEFLSRHFLVNPIKNKDDSLNFESIDAAIDSILEVIDKDSFVRVSFENRLIELISLSLSNDKLYQERRDKLCGIWIRGLITYLHFGSFISDNKYVLVLWNQITLNASLQVKFEIKKLMLRILIFQGQRGVIKPLADSVRVYLEHNQIVASQFFAVIVKLAENHMTDMDLDTNCEEMLRECFVEGILWQSRIFDFTTHNQFSLCHISKCGLNFENERFAVLMHDLVVSLLKKWNDSISQNMVRGDLDYSCVEDVKEYFRREIIEKDGDAKREIDFLFDDVDFTAFKETSIQFYQDIFGWIYTKYFESYEKQEKRDELVRKIRYIESKVVKIENESVRTKFYRFLCFYEGPYYTHELEKLKTKYSYEERKFINGQFEKYGKYNLDEMFQTIQMLHLKELLPEILPSVSKCLNSAQQEKDPCLYDSLNFVNHVTRTLVTEAYNNHSDALKQDFKLTESYEQILDVMIECGNEYAAVLQDEFRTC